ncbi:MAG: pilus assembly protein TadG-related protein, partial [Clostridiales bacterium]|nr:pilus assembly protein TadG-related protein [Clostridiales bacterium]
MKKPYLSFLKAEDGAVTVIVALCMTIFMIITAFVLDFGLAYIKASDIQNAADAAVLATGQLLPLRADDEAAISEAKNSAVLYAEKNGSGTIPEQDVTLGDLANGKYTSIQISI